MSNNEENKQKNIIMKNLIKENEILSKVIKDKLGHNEAINELLKIMNEKRNFIENQDINKENPQEASSEEERTNPARVNVWRAPYDTTNPAAFTRRNI